MSELTEFRKSKDESSPRMKTLPSPHNSVSNFVTWTTIPRTANSGLLWRWRSSPIRKKPTEIITNTGDTNTQVRWGKFTFPIDGQEVSLTVFRGTDDEELFLPFADSTSGGETYGAGRYLGVVPLRDGRYLIDFNYAYNPYCAYNPHWSCPIPPPGNRLKVPIHAGEKVFPDAPVD